MTPHYSRHAVFLKGGIVKCLNEHGANINKVDRYGETPLF